MSTNYWYIRENKLKFVDDYGNEVDLDPITVRYRRRLSAEIRNVDDALFSNSATRDSNIIPDGRLPLPPRLLSPENGSNGIDAGADISLTWGAANSGALPTLYCVYVGYDPDAEISEWMFKEIDASQVSIKYTAFSADADYLAPTEGLKVYWTVTAYNSYGESTVPTAYSYEYIKGTAADFAPNAPTLTAPADETEDSSLTPTLTWSIPTVDGTHSAATGYVLSVSSSIIGSLAYLVDNNFTFTSPLDYGTAYTWKVRAFNGAGNSDWSAERTFTTITLPQGYLWEEQDDGLDTDVQLAALYLMLSRACDLAGGDAKTSRYFFDKYNYMQKELRIKYNSAKYKNITIRPYSF